MQHEFGKRTISRPVVARSAGETTAQPTPERAAIDPTHLRRAILAIVLTVTIVGGMFLLPKMAQCEGGRGALGLDWCRLMKASVEGGVRGVAIGRGTMPAGSR
jgi:hypothetical protein